MSDHGDRAIILAPRGESLRLARLDLLTKRVQPWCDARVDRFAPDFDGSTWFVSRGDTIYAIDATADRWEHLWKVDEHATFVSAIRRNEKALSAWFVQGGSDGEVWTFELPSHTLRERRAVSPSESPLQVGSISPGGFLAGWLMPSGAQHIARIHRYGAWKDLPVTTSALPELPCVTDDWLALPIVDEAGTVIHLLDANDMQERVRISLGGAMGNAGARVQGEHLIVFDGCGRVMVLSLRSGGVIREYRVA
jgi:hypothetical protein